MSDSLWPHGLQHARLSCPSLFPRVCSNSCPLSQWYHPTFHPLWPRVGHNWATEQHKGSSLSLRFSLILTDADCPQTGLVSIQTYTSLGLKGSPDHFKHGWSQNAMVSDSNLGLLLSSSYCSILKMSTVQYIVGTLNSHPDKWCYILSVTQTRSHAIITNCPSAFPAHSGPHPVAPSLERMDIH